MSFAGTADAPPGAPDVTVDGFLDHRVTLVQPRGGHRAGLDAALLQALVPAEAEGLAVDLGTGVGTIAFCVAARAAGLLVTGVERDASLVECARAALALRQNAGFAGRVRIVEADVRALSELERAGLQAGSADWVLMNPPYDAEGRVCASPDERRREARVAGPDALSAWVDSAAALLKRGGALGLIHRATALAAVLALLHPRFGHLRILPIHPAAEKPASRIVVRAQLGSRASLQLMPPLVLHDASGAWTPAADAVLRGRAGLFL